MIQQINTVQDTVTFINQLAAEVDNYHPLEDFSRYQYTETNRPRYTVEEAALRNNLVGRCFEVCADQDADFFYLSQTLFQQAKDHLPRTGAVVSIRDCL